MLWWQEKTRYMPSRQATPFCAKSAAPTPVLSSTHVCSLATLMGLYLCEDWTSRTVQERAKLGSKLSRTPGLVMGGGQCHRATPPVCCLCHEVPWDSDFSAVKWTWRRCGRDHGNRSSLRLWCPCPQPAKKKQRAQVIEFFIDVARECFNIGNFNSLMAIICE